RTSSILGTAGYVSPEQARGEPVDHRSDIYSLGCVLYEMLTGRQPFQAADPLAVAYKHVHEAVVPPSSLEPSVPPHLEAVTMRAMEKDPAARFQSVAEMTSAMDERTAPVAPVAVTTPLSGIGATTPLPVVTETETLPRRTDRPPPRRRMMPLLLALGVLALLGGLAFAFFGGDPSRDLGGPSASRSPSGAPSRSASPTPSSPSPTPTQPPVDPVQGAVASLQALVNEGVDRDTISEKAAEEIMKGLDEALKRYADGDTDRAIEELDHLRDKVDELVDHDEIAHSEEQALRKAIEDLAVRMLEASSGDD
ncbi:MAG: protein kinase domain-containing protein, partial [Candidatus Dormibacteria bacterium]